MILRFYRRGVEGVRTQVSGGKRTGTGGCAERQACAECAAAGTAGRQLLLDFEEDRICIVREVQRKGCIGGTRPWSAPKANEAPEGPWPGGLRWPQQSSAPGNDDCA